MLFHYNIDEKIESIPVGAIICVKFAWLPHVCVDFFRDL